MAARVLDLLPDVRSAETPKDLGRWYSKREVFHDIYILQGKSLSDVKKIMESDHGFPKTLKQSDYEHVLREQFKFRKNLSADEWRRSISPLIARRKAEGKRSEVFLNGSKVRNVDRRIHRSFKSKRSRRLAKSYTAALPYGLVIRTPSPQPSTLITSPGFDKGFGDTQSEEIKRHQSPMNPLGDPPAEAYWLSLLTDATVPESGSRATLALSAHILRDGCPINNFLSLLDNYQHPFNQADLRLFGPNATISALGKICFDFSNHLQGETISMREMRSILDWIGVSVDIATLRTFFSQQAFTILAVWEALAYTVKTWEHSSAFEVLLAVYLSIKDRGPWTITEPSSNLEDYVNMAPNHVSTMINAYTYDQRELDRALHAAIFSSRPIAVLEKLMSAGASLESDLFHNNSADFLIRYFANEKYGPADLPLLGFLLEAGAVVDQPSPYDCGQNWSGPNTPMYSTDYILHNWGYSTTNQDLWSLVSAYSDRQQTTVTVPGIFEAAQGGQDPLRSYLKARSKPYNDKYRKKVLEIALSEASGRGCANVVQSLLQFGVDPNVHMLSRFNPEASSQTIWHPVIRAVNSGQFHTLRIIVTESSTDIVFLEDIVDEQLDLCSLRNMENSQRGQILQLLSSLDISTEHRSGILLCAIGPHNCGQPGHEAPDYAFVGQLLELGLACLDCRQYFEGKTSHILVRAIHKWCDVRALDYVVQGMVEIPSGISAVSIGELLEATISRPDCKRYEILAFLAQNIKGFRSCAQENVSSLLSCLFRHMGCRHSQARNHWKCGCEGLITLNWFLDLEVPWEGRVLVELIKHANDQFMLGMIHSETDVSTIDGCYALESSIFWDRLNLAVALIERGARVNDTRGENRSTALQQACEKGAPLWFIRFLVDKGEDVNAPPDPDRGFTALQAACFYDVQLSCISFLIEKGADVNAPPAPYFGWTALQCAASSGRMNVAGLLLDRGADVNALSGLMDPVLEFRFMRALDLAAEYSRLDMAHFLIAAGARSHRLGRTGFKGAIEIARDEGNFAVASLVQEHADSHCGDPMEAESAWLRANPHACMYNGKIQGATWVAFVERAGGESEVNVKDYMKEQWEFIVS